MGDLFRTLAAAKRYKDYRAHRAANETCPLCTKPPLHAFIFWKIIPNDFPYDLIAETHHMIIPLRHVVEEKLTEDERSEFLSIKQSHLQDYTYIIEATRNVKSIPEHFHLHLIIGKKRTNVLDVE